MFGRNRGSPSFFPLHDADPVGRYIQGHRNGLTDPAPDSDIMSPFGHHENTPYFRLELFQDNGDFPPEGRSS